MAYTTITKEIAEKAPELAERIGETISKKELAEIQTKYTDAKAAPVRPRKVVVRKARATGKRKVTRKAK